MQQVMRGEPDTMPEPREPPERDAGAREIATIAAPTGGSGRIRALDGLRGLAVAAVVVYHLSPDLLPGGFLGVSVFFVLSGFLITSLLLDESTRTGRIALRGFWGRRFRRLMPAALAGLALAVVVAAAVGDAHQLSTLPGDVIAALAYIANWRFIAQGTDYGAHYLQPSVVQHYWSLAIEEQFYLVVAVVTALLARVTRSRRAWLLTFATLAIASMAATVVLGPGDHTRIYFGTGTRAVELLVGSVLAIAVVGRAAVPSRPRTRRALLAAGVAGLAGLVVAFRLVSLDQPIVYEGGLWVGAAVTAVVVLALRAPGPVARALSWRPLVGLGLISYGVYLYHWPLFIWLTPSTVHLDGLVLAAVRIAATLVLSLASYWLLEQPIRRQRWHLPLGLTAAVGTACVVAIAAGSVAVGHRSEARAVVSTPDIELATPPAAPSGPPQAGLDAPSVAAPSDVLLLGDSVLHDAFPSIEHDFAAIGVRSEAIGGPGQTLMSDGARWLDDISAAVAADDPDVVVLESCCGSQDRWTAPDGRVLQPDTPEFWVEWERLTAEATVRAGAAGARVFWVVPPPADGVKSRWYGDIKTRMAEVGQIVRRLATTRPELRLVDWSVLANPDGSYSATLPDRSGTPVVIRAEDGVHFSPAGRALQARTTVDQVLAGWTAAGGRTQPTASQPGA